MGNATVVAVLVVSGGYVVSALRTNPIKLSNMRIRTSDGKILDKIDVLLYVCIRICFADT
eukprot:6185538-Pleurochrysis_carterae.AAC.1